MTVDLCTRIWTTPRGDVHLGSMTSASRESSPAAHRKAMHCVDAAVIVGYRSERLGQDIPAQRVAALVHADPQLYVGFAGIDPTSQTLDADLAEVLELGLVGIAIAPADCGVRATDDRCTAALRWAAAHDLPVLVSNPGLRTPGSMLEFARPSHFDDALRDIENLTLVIGDVGQCYADEALCMIDKHERAFAEIGSAMHRPSLLRRILVDGYETGVMHKLLFASGFPTELPERAIARLYGMAAPGAAGGLPEVPREKIREIIERDSLALLGIEHVGTAAPMPRPVVRPLRRLEVADNS